MTVEFNAVNISQDSKNVQFILALHDAGGMLIGVSEQESTIAPNADVRETLEIQIPANTNGLSLRVMVWDSASDAPHTLMIVEG